jgi:predicted transcriptional regulator
MMENIFNLQQHKRRYRYHNVSGEYVKFKHMKSRTWCSQMKQLICSVQIQHSID